MQPEAPSEREVLHRLYLKAVGALSRVRAVAAEVGEEGVEHGERDDVADRIRVHQPREGDAHKVTRRVEDRPPRVAGIDGGIDLHTEIVCEAADENARDDAASGAHVVAAHRESHGHHLGGELGQTVADRDERQLFASAVVVGDTLVETRAIFDRALCRFPLFGQRFVKLFIIVN